MPNYANLVSQIRTLLAGSNFTRSAKLESLARDYAAACQAANQRLVLCQDFLNKGLRCEAVHHAQTPPDLLDSLGVLDFPERTRWDELTTAYGLPGAAQPNHYGAAALNQAFADHAPLEPLITRLRRLAIEQGPVSDRLQILHDLMRIDPQNPVWSESIGDFEKKRLQELERDIENAIGRKDAVALQTLQQELISGWVIPPPPALLASVQRSLKKLVDADHLRQLEALTNELTTAFARRQIDQVRDMLDRWRNLTERMGGNIPAAIQAKTKPVLAWNAKENKRVASDAEYQTVLEDMRITLEHNRTPETLRAKWKALEEFHRSVPVELRDRFQTVLEQIEQAKTRRQRKWMAWAGVGCATLAAGLWLVVSSIGVELQFQDKVQTLAANLDQGNLVEADLFHQSLTSAESAYTMNRQEMAAQKLRLDAFKKTEKERQTHFAGLLTDIENDSNPAEGSLTVKKARRAAKTDKDKLAIDRLLRDRKERAAAEQHRHDSHHEEEHLRLAALLTEAERHLEGPQFETKLKEVEQSLVGLSAKEKAVSEHVAANMPVLALKTRAATLRNRAELIAKTDSRFTEMSQAFSADGFDLDKFVRAAQGLSDITANPELSRDLRRAIACEPVWRAISEWNIAMAKKPYPGNEGFSAFLTKPIAGRHPEFMQIQAQNRFRHHDAQELKRNYEAAFNDPLVKGLWKVKRDPAKDDFVDIEKFDPNGQYYVSDALLKRLNPPFEKAGKWIITYPILDYGYSPETVVTGKKLGFLTASCARAPQAELSDEILGLLQKADISDPAIALQVLATTREKADIDPIAHLRLLRDILKPTVSASPLLATLCLPQTGALNALKADLAVPWMNPEDPRTRNSLPKALEERRKFPKFQLVAANLAKLTDEKNAELQQTLTKPIGYLIKAGQGWRIQPTPPAIADDRLVAAWTKEDGTVVWVPLGRLRSRAAIDAPPVNLPQGLLVYSQRTP